MTTRKFLQALAERLDAIDRKVDRIEVATLVRDPGNAVSVDAYNGLRKQVVAAASARLTHLAQLSQIDLAVRAGLDADQLRPLVDEWLQQSGLDRSLDTSHPDHFEIVGGQGPSLTALTPAYLDEVTGRIVRQGHARRGPATDIEPDIGTDSVASAEIDTEPFTAPQGSLEDPKPRGAEPSSQPPTSRSVKQ